MKKYLSSLACLGVIAAAPSSFASQAIPVKAHAFVSMGASQVSEESYTRTLGNMSWEQNVAYDSGQKSDASVFGNTWAGFQFNAQLLEGTQFVYQVIVEADDSATNDFETRTEWMYIKQDLGAGFNTQIGRIRLPAFLDSEVLYVAQTYPWVSAPAEIYSLLPVNHIDGLSVNHRTELADWTIDTKAILWGESKDDSDTYSISLDDTYGLAVDASWESLQVHAAVIVTTEIIDLSLDGGVVPNLPMGIGATSFEDDLTHAVLGARWDDGQVYASGELVNISADKGIVDETEAYNLTLGWYFGDVLPYISYSSTETTNKDDIAGNIAKEMPTNNVITKTDSICALYGLPIDADGTCTAQANIGNIASPFFTKNQKNISIGVKYNITPALAFKAQIQQIDDFEGTGGKFNDPNLPYEEVTVYDVALQAVF